MEEKLIKMQTDFSEDKLNDLCKNAVELINYSRSVVLKEVNLIQLMTYFTLGKWIVEVQQDGASRAQYWQQRLHFF